MKKTLLFFLIIIIFTQIVSARQYSLVNISDCRDDLTFTLRSSNKVVDSGEYNITPNCLGNTTDNVWVCDCINGSYYLNTKVNTVNDYKFRVEYESTEIDDDDDGTGSSSGSGSSGTSGGYYNRTRNTTTNNTSNKTIIPLPNLINETVITPVDTPVAPSVDIPVVTPVDNPPPVEEVIETTTLPPLPNIGKPLLIFLGIIGLVIFIFAFRRIMKKRKKVVIKKTTEEEIQELSDEVNGVKKVNIDVIPPATSNESFCYKCNKMTKDIKSYVSKEKRCGSCSDFKKVKV